MAEVANQLLRALDSLGESAQFCVSGSMDPVLPGLDVKGVGPVGFPITPAVARQLIEKSSQAPYGRGEETIVDPDVRRVWQIEPKQFALHNEAWNELIEDLIERVKTEFGIKGNVKASLYKLLIYEKGSFFAPHRDTEKVEGMFATLVVGLPSRHEGGTLIVSHDRQTRHIDFAGPEGEYKVQYAAFYADCRHEIKPVTEGYRVCLVYNLALAQKKRQPEAPRASDKVEQVAELLARLFEDGSRQKIAIPLLHEYTEAGFGFDSLKGADRARVDVLARAAEQGKYHHYLALMTFRQTGDVDYDTVSYSRYGIQEDSAEMGEVFDEYLTLDHWLDPEGRPQPFGTMNLDKDEIVSATDFEDFPFQQEVSETTGNEGATVERWYRQGVIVIWPPDRYFAILARQGQAAALPALEKLVAGADDSSRDKSCRALAREILAHWKKPHSGRTDAPEPSAMLRLLERIADPALVNQFLRDVLPQDARGTEGEVLCRLANQLGWEVLAEGLQSFVAGQVPDNQTANLATTAAIVEGLCRGPGKMTDPRQAVCRALAAEMERMIRRWDTEKDPHPWTRKGKTREGIIEALASALSAINEGDLLERFQTHALADKAHYDLHTILIPAVRTMAGWKSKEPLALQSLRQVLQHCISELERLTEKPVTEPTDWAQDITLGCHCADCRELQQFLHDPQEKTHRFRVAEARRRHLHQQIDGHGCDMTHVTERSGSPYTLVCTKNRASYERKKAQFATNVQLLKELRGLERPKRKP